MQKKRKWNAVQVGNHNICFRKKWVFTHSYKNNEKVETL